MIKELVDYKQDIMKRACDKFDFDNPQVDPIELTTDLAETMISNNGLGLSANQIGYPYQAFVINSEEIIAVFNPKIVDISEETTVLDESCLSIPGFYVKVKRPKKIKVRYTQPNGEVVTKTFEGMTAKIFIHQWDYLRGINMKQRANKYHLELANKRMRRK